MIARTDASMAEVLNNFFASFETVNSTASSLTPPSTRTLTFQEHEVRRMLRSVNPRKVIGLDGVSGEVHKTCADQLAGVFTN